MNQISKWEVDEFEKRLKAEKELLLECETEPGFFDRIRTCFLPFLRTDYVSTQVVAKWQGANTDLSHIIKANDQLTTAFLQLWRHAAKLRDRALKRQLIQILRKVKGPARYFEFSSWTITRVISFDLRPLYSQHIAKTAMDNFIFAPAAHKLEEREKEFHALSDNDPSLLWAHMITLENCMLLKDGLDFSLRWETIRGDKSTIGIRAHQMHQRFALAFSAPELRALGKPNRKPHYFIREVFERYIDRICKELMRSLLSMIVKEPSPLISLGKKAEDEPHWRTKKLKEDLRLLIPIAREVWKEALKGGQDPAMFSQEVVAKKVKEIAEARKTPLQLKTPSRYLQAAKETDPREYAAAGGAYLGLKSAW